MSLKLQSNDVFAKLLNLNISSCYGDNGSLDKILRAEEMFESISILSSDLLYKIEPGHCYTIITDPLYQEILQPKLFQEISESTYFVLKIPFNEDMLNPNEKMLLTLHEARTAGCRCYLIYLANGIQMERFLRFIDRFVEITSIIHSSLKTLKHKFSFGLIQWKSD